MYKRRYKDNYMYMYITCSMVQVYLVVKDLDGQRVTYLSVSTIKERLSMKVEKSRKNMLIVEDRQPETARTYTLCKLIGRGVMDVTRTVGVKDC